MRSILISLTLCVMIAACSQSRRIAKGQPEPNGYSVSISAAQQTFISDTALAGAHAGISIYDPAASRYLYNYQGDKYFVPASNTKLFTCYAAMKYLGDSLVGARYQDFSDGEINIFPSGDPTFLHSDFASQPVLQFFQQSKKQLLISATGWKDSIYGKGWGWDDYNEYYMPERSPFPIQGNTVKFNLNSYKFKYVNGNLGFPNLNWSVAPAYFKKNVDSFFSQIPLEVLVSPRMRSDSVFRKRTLLNFSIKRGRYGNQFLLVYDTVNPGASRVEIPFITDGLNTGVQILKSDYAINLQKGVRYDLSLYGEIPEHLRVHTIHSRPTDSLLKPMMHRSDNFFAEQSLLMVSNEKLGYMSDEAIIDTLLKTDLKDLPQKPVWVDGSGLSRYNMFTPQDMVAVLLKMKNEFGLERIRNILPKGNTGTLTNYYQQIGPAIFAKTGSLSGQVALSGFLTCKTGRLLIFSVMINNYTNSGRAVRRAIEKFVMQVWEKN